MTTIYISLIKKLQMSTWCDTMIGEWMILMW